MMKLVLIIIGAILLIWFLLPVFTYKILNIGNITGIIVSLILLLYGIFFRPINRFLAAVWQYRVGKVIEIIIGVCILAILILAVTTMICMARGMQQKAAAGSACPQIEISGQVITQDLPPEGEAAQKAAKTVIVLGCKVIGEAPSLMLSERLQTARSYLNMHPDSHAIVSGGQGEDEIVAEAEVMYNWLIQNGISADRLLKEDRSVNTQENLQYSYDLLMGINEAWGSSGWNTDVVIVTNEFHEYRALEIARAVGFRAEPLPAATAWWLFPTYYVREMYGILEHWFLK